MREAGLEPIPVTITGGRHTSFDGLHWRVPKQALLRPLVAAMDAGRLRVAKSLREAEAFQREFLAFQQRITDCGNNAFEGVGEHDDLVIATSITISRPAVVAAEVEADAPTMPRSVCSTASSASGVGWGGSWAEFWSRSDPLGFNIRSGRLGHRWGRFSLPGWFVGAQHSLFDSGGG